MAFSETANGTEKRSNVFTLRFTDEELKEIRDAAAKEHRTISNWVRVALRKALSGRKAT